MEIAAMMMEVEDDDVFFADLNKQISLLITDESDGDNVYYSPPMISSCYPTSVSIQDYYSRKSTFPTIHYQFDQMNYKSSTTTTTTDQSKGTGVFIPKSSSQWNRSRRSKHQQPTNKTTNYNSYNNTNNFRHYHHQQQQLPSQAVFSQVIIASKKC